MENQDKSKAHPLAARQAYVKPVLRELGSLAAITLSGRGSQAEVDWNPSPNNKRCGPSRRRRPC